MIDVSTSGHHIGDCRALLRELPDGCAQTCITSPPYWGLRDYGHPDQIGLEQTPEEYVAQLVAVFREVRRVLADDGTLWINLGDSYAGTGSGPQGATGQMSDRAIAAVRSNVTKGGPDRPGACRAPARGPRADNNRRSTLEGSTSAQDAARNARERGRNAAAGLKPKDLVGIPWEVAFALRADGWYLRSDIIWHKPNPMPESVRDRPTKAHEYVFLLSKGERYFYDNRAAAEPSKWLGQNRSSRAAALSAMPGAPPHRGLRHDQPSGKRNLRSVWTVPTQPFKGAHFATFPPRLIEPCVLAGSRPGDLVLDTFFGSGTTGMVAERNGRRWIGFDLGYEDVAAARLKQASLGLAR
jgi:DNA modification methylase